MSFSDLAVAIPVAGFTYMAIAAVIAPTRVAEEFGIAELSVAGRSEVRGVYGGFGLAMAGALIAALSIPELRTGALVAVGAALAGMGGGRVVSVLGDRRIDRRARSYLGVEVVGAAMLFYAA